MVKSVDIPSIVNMTLKDCVTQVHEWLLGLEDSILRAVAEPPHLSGTERRSKGGRFWVQFLGWNCVWLGDEKKEAPGAMGMFGEIAANAEQLLERIEKGKGETKAAGQQQQPAPDPNAFIIYLEFMDRLILISLDSLKMSRLLRRGGISFGLCRFGTPRRRRLSIGIRRRVILEYSFAEIDLQSKSRVASAITQPKLNYKVPKVVAQRHKPFQIYKAYKLVRHLLGMECRCRIPITFLPGRRRSSSSMYSSLGMLMFPCQIPRQCLGMLP